MACHGGKGAVLRIFLLNAGILYAVLISPLFSPIYGGQRSFTRFGLVSILFLFQILIFYIN